MSTGFFGDIQKVKYEGPDSDNPLAFRHYNPDEIVLGKRMEDHLRFAVAYWHSFAREGGDPFGGRTFDRPRYSNELDAAKLKADVAFEFFSRLARPIIASMMQMCGPKGATLRKTRDISMKLSISSRKSRPKPA